MKDIWYNYWQPDYVSEEPHYYSADEYEWAQDLLANYAAIKDELMMVVEARDGKFSSHYASELNDKYGEWTTMGFKTWGIKVKKHLRLVPYINNWLENHPQISSCSVNVLEPGASIGEHAGDTNAILRCHLGIEIPCGLPELGFNVEGEEMPWIQGGFLIFRDSFKHHAWNSSTKRRIIFVVDVIEDQFLEKKTQISINVRAFQVLHWLANKWKWVHNRPKSGHRFLFVIIRILLYILYPVQKITGVIRKH
jgi:aspartyl/asparaginyl beta-hydroxylase (cupin superfamily)